MYSKNKLLCLVINKLNRICDKKKFAIIKTEKKKKKKHRRNIHLHYPILFA